MEIKQIVSVNQCYYFPLQVFRKVNQGKELKIIIGGFIPLFSASAGALTLLILSLNITYPILKHQKNFVYQNFVSGALPI